MGLNGAKKEQRFRTLASPPVLLGLFVLDFLLVAWLIATQVRNSLLMTGAVVLAVLGLLLYSRLSTLVREADRALDQGEHYIESVAGLSQDIQSIIDVDGRSYAYMNPAVEKALGYKPEEFLEGGLDFFVSLVHPEDRPHVKQEMERILGMGSNAPSLHQEEFVQEEIYRIRTKWEEYRWFRSRRKVFTRREDGTPRELLTVAQDITEQRGFEIALVQAQEFESLGTLARRLAHDLNNILMGIQGYSELGMDSHGDVRSLQESLLKIHESASRATEICSQMLAYAGRGRLQIARHQLNDAIREGLPLVEGLLPENIQLVLELENDLPKVNADPNQVRYALLHLVVNAMESLGARQGEINISTHLKHLGGDGDTQVRGLLGDFVCLEVQDSGPGMSEETLGGISDPFFRVKHPGRGLGLLTVMGIAAEHHGSLQVESTEGLGTRCALYFPIAEAEPQIDEGDEGTPISTEAGVILLVDDEPTIRAILRQGFENAGFKVIEATDGVEGFGAFVRHRSSISVVLLDLTMPRMGGDEVFAEIHKLAPEVPVILMSGYSQQEATAALAGMGLTAFLSKPCSIKEALAVVRKALENNA